MTYSKTYVGMPLRNLLARRELQGELPPVQRVRGITFVALWKYISTSYDPGLYLEWTANQAPVRTDNRRLA